MQPDSSKPAVRTPSVSFSDGILSFQSKVQHARRDMRLNATIPKSAIIIVEIGNNSRA